MSFPFNEAISLLFYPAHGFLAMQLYRVHYPAKRMSQFESVAWSIIHSFVNRTPSVPERKAQFLLKNLI